MPAQACVRLAVTAILAVAIGVASRASAAPSKILRELACTSCHLDDSPTRFMYESFDAFTRAPPPAPTGCARCHVSNAVAAATSQPARWLPLSAPMLERIRRFHAYVETPALTTSVELAGPSGSLQRLPRFTRCGLERFLSSPLPRHAGAQQSMFPLDPATLRKLLGALGPELERCDDGDRSTSSPELRARGRELFDRLACAGCHAGSGKGPRLRLGYPLLGRAYFGARVRHGAGNRAAPQIWQRRWQAASGDVVATRADAIAMPPHADLTEADLDALYAYVGSDRADVPAPAPSKPPVGRIEVPEAIRLSLFREVQRRVFDTSCRHCHSPDTRDQTLIKQVFGDAPPSAPVELPMTRLAVSPNATLRAVLTAGPGCSDSPLLTRLKARAAEWAGHPLPGAPRGMPMTLPPIDNDAVRLVEVWTAAGCPSDRGALCEPCAAPDASAAK